MRYEAVPERRIWLLVAGMFVLLCMLAWLDEIVDLPHLLLGASPTPVNWREGSIETVLIACVGLYVVFRLRAETEFGRVKEALQQALRREEAMGRIRDKIIAIRDLPEPRFDLGQDLVEEWRDLGVPIYSASLQLPSAQPGTFESFWSSFPGQPGLSSGVALLDYPWVKEVWDSGKPVVVSRERLDRVGFAIPEVQCILEVPLPGGGSLGVNSKVADAFDSEAIGTVQAFAGVISEGLQRAQDLETLRKSEENFRRMATHIEDVLYSVDGETQEFQYVSPAFERLLGYTLEDIRGMGGRRAFLSQVIQEGKFAEQEQIFEQLHSQQTVDIPDRYEVWWRCKDGSLRCLEDHWIPVYDGERLVSTDGVLRDITERVRAQERTERLNAVLRAIRSINQLVVREKDRDHLLQGVCDTLIATRGYHSAWAVLLDESGGFVAADEAGIGEPFLPMVEQLRRGELPDCGRRALSQSGVVVIEDPSSTCADCPLSGMVCDYGTEAVRVEHDGKVYGVLTVSVPVEYVADEEEEEQVLFAEVARDIAFALHSIELEEERKRAEEALREYSNRLEKRVEERTRELREAQEQLVRRERLAVLGQLAGGVGHELRNPLGAIKNAAYFLNMVIEEPEPEVKEMLEVLDKEVGTSEGIISSLLDFARPKPLSQQPADVNEVVQEALSRTTVPENVEVVSRLDEALPIIPADPVQLSQVFGNIVLNAIQAMSEGGQLTVTSEVAGPEWVSVSFTDTGVGISEENSEKLFEPLFTTKARGIGLGLALVKTLVEGHGGTIEVQSEMGRGSTFTVRLPISGESAQKEVEGEVM